MELGVGEEGAFADKKALYWLICASVTCGAVALVPKSAPGLGTVDCSLDQSRDLFSQSKFSRVLLNG